MNPEERLIRDLSALVMEWLKKSICKLKVTNILSRGWWHCQFPQSTRIQWGTKEMYVLRFSLVRSLEVEWPRTMHF